MRFANNNKAIINKLTKRRVKTNKLRNLFAITAIALTTILFTTLFTIGMGMVESMEQQTMRQAGGYAHGSFKDLTGEEFNKIKDHPLIKELGYSIFVSMGENQEFLKRHTEVRYATDTQAKLWFSSPTTGRMPLTENEVATDTEVLDLLGVPHQLGEKVVIKYSLGNEQQSQEFIVSGFWETDEVSPGSMIMVSHEFIDKKLASMNQVDIKDKQIDTGLIYADVMFKNSRNIEQNMDTVLKDSGYSGEWNAPNFIATGVNWAYISTNFELDLPTILSLLAAILLIVFTGYLIIYNIFQISVSKDIRFYGLLKTIGTTPRQIKRLVAREALLLSIIGIPIGLLLGYLLGNLLLPIIMSTSNIRTSYSSISPVIFIGAVIFSLITVFISCRKPGKIAAKVSPVEATRYIDAPIHGKPRKKSVHGGKIYRMALSNMLRNKRKTVVVVISMSLSLILLNSVFTLTNGFSIDKFVSKFVITDFVAGNANYFNALKGFHSDEDVISEQMIQSIDSLAGIQEGGRIYYDVSYTNIMINGQKVPIQLYGMEDLPLSQLNVYEGELDIDQLKTGNYLIEGVDADDNGNIRYETSKFNIGDKVMITIGDGQTKEYEVMAKAVDQFSMSVRYSYGSNSCMLYLPAEEFISQINNPLTMSYVFNVEDQHEKEVEGFLHDYTNNIEPQMDYESKLKLVDQFKGFQAMFVLVGSALSIIIGVIGILNFVNAILTSVIARRREFAVLQSIGMTNQQLNSMLVLEGVFYALATIVLSSIFSILLSYSVVQPIGNNLWFFDYQFVFFPLLIASPMILFVSCLVPYLASRSLNKHTIVERLREAE